MQGIGSDPTLTLPMVPLARGNEDEFANNDSRLVKTTKLEAVLPIKLAILDIDA